MFRMIGFGENVGSGFPKIIAVYENFYRLCQPYSAPQTVEQIIQQVAEQKEIINTPQLEEQCIQQPVEPKKNAITPQLGEQIRNDIFSITWGHHKVLIDKNMFYKLLKLRAATPLPSRGGAGVGFGLGYAACKARMSCYRRRY